METIDIKTLTPEQLKSLRAELRAAGAVVRGDVDRRNAVIDPMLAERGADGEFAHTTVDILARLQTEQVAPAELSAENRKWWLKAIQTRKQKLEKLVVDGKLVHAPGSLGYKASATGFTLTVERVVEWLAEQDADVRKRVRSACK